jgi:hypothetical protein
MTMDGCDDAVSSLQIQGVRHWLGLHVTAKQRVTVCYVVCNAFVYFLLQASEYNTLCVVVTGMSIYTWAMLVGQ